MRWFQIVDRTSNFLSATANRAKSRRSKCSITKLSLWNFALHGIEQRSASVLNPETLWDISKAIKPGLGKGDGFPIFLSFVLLTLRDGESWVSFSWNQRGSCSVSRDGLPQPYPTLSCTILLGDVFKSKKIRDKNESKRTGKNLSSL